MFGLGNDSKRKLEENMEDIKDMVESEENQNPAGKGQEKGGFQSENPDPEKSSPNPAPENKLQEEIERFESKKEPQKKQDPPETREAQEETKKQTAVRSDIPEPARTKEIDVPDIDKGPLFITQEKFETASRLIYQMRNLTQQIEDTVRAMEDDLGRERQKEQSIQNVLNEYEQGRKDVEKIVSPEK